MGFAWFALFLPQPAALSVKTDAVVVLTGGSNRIEHALQVLEAGNAKRMLISGVDHEVRPSELASEYKRPLKLFLCCIDLGFESVDTRSNALETARWVADHKIKSLRLVTHDWHMRRAELELDNALPSTVSVVNDAVKTRPPLWVLFKEYHKFLFRWAASLLGI